jgi:hypothetical protein
MQKGMGEEWEEKRVRGTPKISHVQMCALSPACREDTTSQ